MRGLADNECRGEAEARRLREISELPFSAVEWTKAANSTSPIRLGPVRGGPSAHLCLMVTDTKQVWPAQMVARLFGLTGKNRVLLAEQELALHPLEQGVELCRYQGAPFECYEAETFIPTPLEATKPIVSPTAVWWLRCSWRTDAPGPHNPGGFTRCETGTIALATGAPTMIAEADPMRRRILVQIQASNAPGDLLLLGPDPGRIVFPFFRGLPAVEFRTTRPVFGVQATGADMTVAWWSERDLGPQKTDARLLLRRDRAAVGRETL